MGTYDAIVIDEQEFPNNLEPVVECVEESSDEVGTPLSVLYDQMDHEEPDADGKFPRSKKKKGVSKKKSYNNNSQ